MMLNNYFVNTILGAGLFRFQYLFFSQFVNEITAHTIYALNHAVFFGSLCSAYKLGWISNNNFYNLLGISLGETLHDLLLVYKKKDYPMTIHHVFMTLSIVFPMLERYGLIQLPSDYLKYFSQLYLCEWSNVFLNISYILYKNDLSHFSVFKYINYGLIGTYFPLRICNFTFIQYYLFTNKHYVIFGLMAPNTLLNYYWFYKLIQKANKLSKDDKND